MKYPSILKGPKAGFGTEPSNELEVVHLILGGYLWLRLTFHFVSRLYYLGIVKCFYTGLWLRLCPRFALLE
jgi:hypothetical protein